MSETVERDLIVAEGHSGRGSFLTIPKSGSVSSVERVGEKHLSEKLMESGLDSSDKAFRSGSLSNSCATEEVNPQTNAPVVDDGGDRRAASLSEGSVTSSYSDAASSACSHAQSRVSATSADVRDADNDDLILTVDVGSTNIRCDVINKAAQCKGTATEPLGMLYPQQGHVEIDPDVLWTKVNRCIKNAIAEAERSLGYSEDIPAKEKARRKLISCMGITTIRNTFITWDRDSGLPFHNFISWQDKRTHADVKKWNESMSIATLHAGSGLLYRLTGLDKFKAASVLHFRTEAVPNRLLWVLDNTPGIRKRLKQKAVCFGTLDTWLLWKFTGGKVHATDHSNASSTLLYDPYQTKWSPIIASLTGIPSHILPEILNTNSLFGETEPELFGYPIPITALVADQQASMFGHRCFEPGSTKCTIGTGSFLDVNTGKIPHASITGIYPLVGWRIDGETTFLAEGHSTSAGECIEWLITMGMVERGSETEALARSVSSSNGVYFVPAFHGLQEPINDDKAACLLIGMQPTTEKAHIVRAVLESVVFQIKLLYETLMSETKQPLPSISMGGGVSQNDFVLQLLADLLQKPVYRPVNVDTSSLGVAFLAGLGLGIWSSKEEIKKISLPEKCFKPKGDKVWEKYRPVVTSWEKALRRAKDWYK